MLLRPVLVTGQTQRLLRFMPAECLVCVFHQDTRRMRKAITSIGSALTPAATERRKTSSVKLLCFCHTLVRHTVVLSHLMFVLARWKAVAIPPNGIAPETVEVQQSATKFMDQLLKELQQP